MTTRKNLTWMLAALLALGTGLGAASITQADGPNRSGRGNDRRPVAVAPSHDRDGHDRDARPSADHDRDGGIRVGIVLGDRDAHPGMRWGDGYYTTQTQQVLVTPAHYEIRYTPAVTQTQRDRFGRLYTVTIQPAGYTQVWVPACYQSQSVQVWVPGRWEPIPVVHDAGLRINIGGLIRF